MDVFITIFGGLGLFFVGIKLIGSNLRQIGGRTFRAVLSRAVSNPFRAASLGLVVGALTQSTNAVTFICINAVSAGLVQARQILAVLIWSNVGTSVLILLASINIHFLILFVIGVVGLLYYADLDKSVRFRFIIAALLGAGLLFLGVDFIHVGADQMRDMAPVREAFEFASRSYAIVFLIGAAIALVAQSSATVTVIAIAMVAAGILDLDHTIVIVYGAGVGSGAAIALMAAKLSGTQKQIAMLQVITKMAGAVVLLPLFFLEIEFRLPLVRSLVEHISPRPQEQIAWTYVVYQFVSSALAHIVREPLYRMMRRLFPETVEESLLKPHFIHATGDIDAEIGVVLVEKEQRRLVGFIRDSLDHVREDAEAERAGRAGPGLLNQAARSVGGEISSFLADLMETSPPRETMERLAALFAAQGLLTDLANEIHALVTQAGVGTPTPALAPLIGNMIESLHLIVTTTLDELENPEEFQRAALAALTSDRSTMMDRLRRDLTRGDRELTPSEQEILFTATTLFEHTVWLVRRYLALVRTAD